MKKILAAILACGVSVTAASGNDLKKSSNEPQDRSIETIGEKLGALRILKAVPSLALRDLFCCPSAETEEVGSDYEEDLPVLGGSIEPVSDIIIYEPPRLIGIVIKESGREAYFLDNGESHTAKEGEGLTNRYRVERIQPQQVRLRDVATGLVRTIDWRSELQ